MLVDELNEMGLPNMAAELDKLYAAPGFLEMDRLTLISELISPEYKDKISKRINNRLRSAKLIGCPAEIGNCTDSQEREYLPSGIPQMLSTLDFIPKGFNICNTRSVRYWQDVSGKSNRHKSMYGLPGGIFPL